MSQVSHLYINMIKMHLQQNIRVISANFLQSVLNIFLMNTFFWWIYEITKLVPLSVFYYLILYFCFLISFLWNLLLYSFCFHEINSILGERLCSRSVGEQPNSEKKSLNSSIKFKCMCNIYLTVPDVKIYFPSASLDRFNEFQLINILLSV